MKHAALLASALISFSVLWGCRSGPESVHVTTETSERVTESSIVEPGTPPQEQQPQERITIRTQTEERGIEEEPAVK